MTAVTWDAITASETTTHAVAGWATGYALCGLAVVPAATALNPDAWRPRCRRCTTKAAQR